MTIDTYPRVVDGDWLQARLGDPSHPDRGRHHPTSSSDRRGLL